MSEVLLERPAEGVVLLRINRPQARNALSMEVRRILAQHFLALEEDPHVRCIVLAGNEKSFAAGADISEMSGVGAIEMLQRAAHKLWRIYASCSKPVISAVRGYALGGGCELAMHGDLIIAGESARFGQPEVRIGILPGGGGTQRLTRAVGKFKAMKMLLTGELVSAREADAMGLVSEVVADDEVESRAIELATQIARLPPLAVMQIKEIVLAGQDCSLDAALMLERKALYVLFASQDQKEGMNAFIEKRPPKFEGR